MADKSVIALLFPGADGNRREQRTVGENAEAVVVVVDCDRSEGLDEAVRFQVRTHAELLAELEKSKSKLDERAIIERAKGALMQRHRVDEAGAYRLIRRSAMKGGRKIRDVAEDILSEMQSR